MSLLDKFKEERKIVYEEIKKRNAESLRIEQATNENAKIAAGIMSKVKTYLKELKEEIGSDAFQSATSDKSHFRIVYAWRVQPYIDFIPRHDGVYASLSDPLKGAISEWKLNTQSFGREEIEYCLEKLLESVEKNEPES